MSSVVSKIEKKFAKPQIVDVRSGDTVRVHQKIREGGKERVQVFEGLVIRTDRKKNHMASVTVRRVSGGVGVEKSYLLHSPLITKVQVVKRSKVRRNYLSYMRQRKGKAARLSGVDFDSEAVNAVHDEQAEAEEAKLHEQAAEEAKEKAEAKAADEAEQEAKAQAALASHDAATKPDEETASKSQRQPAESNEPEAKK